MTYYGKKKNRSVLLTKNRSNSIQNKIYKIFASCTCTCPCLYSATDAHSPTCAHCLHPAWCTFEYTVNFFMSCKPQHPYMVRRSFLPLWSQSGTDRMALATTVHGSPKPSLHGNYEEWWYNVHVVLTLAQIEEVPT